MLKQATSFVKINFSGYKRYYLQMIMIPNDYDSKWLWFQMIMIPND